MRYSHDELVKVLADRFPYPPCDYDWLCAKLSLKSYAELVAMKNAETLPLL